MLRNNFDNVNKDDDEDTLLQFTNNASLTLTPLCGHVGGLMNTAASAAVAVANASSSGKAIKQSTIKKQTKCGKEDGRRVVVAAGR